MNRPTSETMEIISRAAAYSRNPSNVDPTRALDSTNCDLPEGSYLIADVAQGIFILLEGRTSYVFEYNDIDRVSASLVGGLTMILDQDSGVPSSSRMLSIHQDFGKRREAGYVWVSNYMQQNVNFPRPMGPSIS